MEKLKQILKDVLTDEDGQDMLEYALMAALLGLGTMAALRGTKNSTATHSETSTTRCQARPQPLRPTSGKLAG